MPASTVLKNHRSRNGTTTPTARARPVARVDAAADTT
jgi:hypothetical protein